MFVRSAGKFVRSVEKLSFFKVRWNSFKSFFFCLFLKNDRFFHFSEWSKSFVHCSFFSPYDNFADSQKFSSIIETTPISTAVFTFLHFKQTYWDLNDFVNIRKHIFGDSNLYWAETNNLWHEWVIKIEQDLVGFSQS